MKFNKWILGLTVIIGVTLASGCAHMDEKSRTKHTAVHKSAALPPGWSLVGIPFTNNAEANEISNDLLTAPGTNQTGFLANLFAPRPLIFVDFEESWTDESKGGGTFFFTDPTASALSFTHTNQAALGGSRTTSIGNIQSVVDTNTASVIGAAGTAIGNIAAQIINKSTPVGAASGAASAAANAITVPSSITNLKTNL